MPFFFSGTYFDIHTYCTLSLDEIYKGSKVRVEYQEEIDCSACQK